MRDNNSPVYFVVPCGAAKLPHAAAAADLYTGAHFRYVLEAVCVEAALTDAPAVVLILSAKYGLLPLDQVIEPYDVRMGDPDSITADALAAQCQALGLRYDEATESYPEISCFLPEAYFARLDAALRADDVYAHDVYEAAPGIGYQRGVIGHIGKPIPALAAA
jgi:hypothetical protein